MIAPHLHILHGRDDADTDTWENEGGATCAVPLSVLRHPNGQRKGWDVFDQRDGVTVVTVRWRWVARMLTRYAYWTDYAPAGEGWL